MSPDARGFKCEVCGFSEVRYQEWEFAEWDIFKCPKCEGWLRILSLRPTKNEGEQRNV